MLNELQVFLKTPLGAALADQFTQRGKEDLRQVFAAGDEMVLLLSRARAYMEKTDPADLLLHHWSDSFYLSLMSPDPN